MPLSPAALTPLYTDAGINWVTFIACCKICRHQVDIDPADEIERCDATTTVIYWYLRLVCAWCSSRDIDMVVTGAGPYPAGPG